MLAYLQFEETSEAEFASGLLDACRRYDSKLIADARARCIVESLDDAPQAASVLSRQHRADMVWMENDESVFCGLGAEPPDT